MNKRIRKKKQSELQKAWNVVAQHLREQKEVSYFISGVYTNNLEIEIHTVNPDRTIIKSTLNK